MSRIDRIRVEIWAGVKPFIDREVERSGLTPTEIINISLIKFYGIDPQQSRNTLPTVQPSPKPVQEPEVEDCDDLGL
jgi:hypothetical protein